MLPKFLRKTFEWVQLWIAPCQNFNLVQNNNSNYYFIAASAIYCQSSFIHFKNKERQTNISQIWHYLHIAKGFYGGLHD